MKAIKQIIDYLRERGELSRTQLTELASQGLLAWHEVYAEKTEEKIPEENHDEPAATEFEEETLPREPIGRKGRGRPPKAPALLPHELCGRLVEVFLDGEENLAGLVQLARPLAGCASWSEAAIVVRNASLADVEDAIEHGLRSHALSLRQLWDFLAEEGFRTAISEEQLLGPVGSSYRALLAAAEPAHLGRHAALLHYEEVQKVFNLRMAQRKSVRAWTVLYDRQPDLIGLALKREEHWLAYWSMVMLYTARRGKPGSRPEPAAHEDWPEHNLPDEQRIRRAWAHAAFMDPLAVLPLLQEHEQIEAGSSEGAEPLPGRFLCPRSWNRRYYRLAPQT